MVFRHFFSIRAKWWIHKWSNKASTSSLRTIDSRGVYRVLSFLTVWFGLQRCMCALTALWDFYSTKWFPSVFWLFSWKKFRWPKGSLNFLAFWGFEKFGKVINWFKTHIFWAWRRHCRSRLVGVLLLEKICKTFKGFLVNGVFKLPIQLE